MLKSEVPPLSSYIAAIIVLSFEKSRKKLIFFQKKYRDSTAKSQGVI